MAGFLINSRGTTIMIDLLLEGFDMPIMIDTPIASVYVPGVDAILVTHSDSALQRPDLPRAGSGHPRYHSTAYLASLMQNQGAGARSRHRWHSRIGPVRVELTLADHAWQTTSPGAERPRFPT